jgi:acyl dehydratase
VPRHHWEDFTLGQIDEYGPRLLTREEIMAFAAEFDPQPMHLDEGAAAGSMLGGLAASGWHGCCILMRIISDGFLCQAAFMGAPGVEEVKWLAPIRPGEQLKVRATVLETRASRSRADIGFVKFRFEVVDTGGRALLSMVVSPMFGRRPDAAARLPEAQRDEGRA